MDWRQRVASWFYTPPEPRVERVVETVVERPVTEAGPVGSTRAQDAEWRSLHDTNRDLTPLMHDRHLEVARNLATTHALGKRLVEIHVDLVVSDGIEIKATSKDDTAREATQKIIDEFTEANELDELFPELVKELSVSGELDAAPFVREWDGLTRIGLILAENVDRITKHPLNALRLDTLIMKEWVVQDAEAYAKAAGQNSDAEDKQDPRRWPIMRKTPAGWEGRVWTCQVNNLPASTRGLSDLLPIADWLDRFHQALHSEGDRMRSMKAFAWDVEIEGAQESDIIEWKRKHREPPKPNTVLVHNEKEKWDVKAPELNTADTLPLIDEFKKLCLGSMGIPIHYWVEAENVNRASADQMSTPVMSKVRKRQMTVCGFIRRFVEYQLQQARARNRLQGIPESEQTFEVLVREPDSSELERVGKGLDHLVSFLTRMVMAGWISNKKAGQTAQAEATRVGIELTEDGWEIPAEMPVGLTPPPIVEQSSEAAPVAESMHHTFRRLYAVEPDARAG